MANVTRYLPSPVAIPSQIELSRNLVSSVCRADKQPLSAAEIANYDTRTVFYDALFDAQSQEVIALGPPLLNLEKDLFPVDASVSGQPAPYKLEKHPHLTIFRFDVRAAGPLDCPDLDIRFPPFAVRVSSRPILHPSSPPALSLMTVQKDNPVSWILDWIRWHHRHHGISRIILYDNASADLPQIAQALQCLHSDLEIVVVDWPFPYGTRSNRSNQFCQIGALNHCRMAFGGFANWCLNLDIDEYLVTRSKTALSSILEGLDSSGCAALLINSYTVPATREQPDLPEHRSICSYRHRLRRPHDGAMKYAYIPKRIQLNLVHAALPSTRGGERLSRLIYASLPKRLARIARAAPSWMARVLPVRAAAVGEVHFLHYRGISTGWKNKSLQHTPANFPESGDLAAMPHILGKALEADIPSARAPAGGHQD